MRDCIRPLPLPRSTGMRLDKTPRSDGTNEIGSFSASPPLPPGPETDSFVPLTLMPAHVPSPCLQP
jgi:hypothetical protein